MAVKKYRNCRTGRIVSCVQWQGDNFREVAEFCGLDNVYRIPVPPDYDLWIRPVAGHVKFDAKLKAHRKVPIVYAHVEIGEWISKDISGLYPINGDYAGDKDYEPYE